MSMKRFVAQKVGLVVECWLHESFVRTVIAYSLATSSPFVCALFRRTRSRNDTLFTHNAFAVLIVKRLSPDVSRWIPQVKLVAQYPKRWSKSTTPTTQKWIVLFRAPIKQYLISHIVISLWVDICCQQPPARVSPTEKAWREALQQAKRLSTCYQDLIFTFFKDAT